MARGEPIPASDPRRILAANLRRLRDERRLSQEQLAGIAELNVSDISRIENLRREPGLRVMVKLARGLSVPIGELLDGIQTAGSQAHDSRQPRG